MTELPVVPGIDPEKLASPWWRLNHLYSIILDKDGKVGKMRLKPQQTGVYRTMHYLNVILKARQIGFTTLIQLFMLDRCIWNPTTRAGVIAHTKDDASEFFDNKIKFAYDNLPQEIKDWAPVSTKNRLELSFAHNDSKIRVGTSMRSGTLNYLHVSEFGKICAQYPEKAKEIVTGAFNTVAPGQYIFVESTAEGRGGKFYDICKDAEELMLSGFDPGVLDFKFYFFPWYDEPKYRLADPRVVVPPDMEEYFEQLKADEGISLDSDQKRWYYKKSKQQGMDMKREYPATPKEAFQQQLEGAIFGQQMRSAYDAVPPRVCEVPHKRSVPVNCFWDLGHNDTTAIWFHQRYGSYDNFIHYHEHRLVDMMYYIEKLREYERKYGYRYGTMFLPHDGQSKHVHSIAGSAADILRVHGFKTRIVPRTPVKMLSIEATRKRFDTCRFDEKRCEKGLICLENYLWTWDEDFDTFRKTPVHNYASNGADAFQTFGMARLDSPFGSFTDTSSHRSSTGDPGRMADRANKSNDAFNPRHPLT